MFILTCKHLYEPNMRTEIFSQILYLLQTLWFKAINFSFIHSYMKYCAGFIFVGVVQSHDILESLLLLDFGQWYTECMNSKFITLF